jgi:hypothetical protein
MLWRMQKFSFKNLWLVDVRDLVPVDYGIEGFVLDLCSKGGIV